MESTAFAAWSNIDFGLIYAARFIVYDMFYTSSIELVYHFCFKRNWVGPSTWRRFGWFGFYQAEPYIGQIG